MAQRHLDVEAFVAALDAKRQDHGISWRELARQAKVSPSTLTRMQQGKRPDVDTFATLVRWLGLPAEEFLTSEDIPNQVLEEVNPMAVASTLLRGKKDMSPEAIEALEELIRAAYKLVKEVK